YNPGAKIRDALRAASPSLTAREKGEIRAWQRALESLKWPDRDGPGRGRRGHHLWIPELGNSMHVVERYGASRENSGTSAASLVELYTMEPEDVRNVCGLANLKSGWLRRGQGEIARYYGRVLTKDTPEVEEIRGLTFAGPAPKKARRLVLSSRADIVKGLAMASRARKTGGAAPLLRIEDPRVRGICQDVIETSFDEMEPNVFHGNTADAVQTFLRMFRSRASDICQAMAGSGSALFALREGPRGCLGTTETLVQIVSDERPKARAVRGIVRATNWRRNEVLLQSEEGSRWTAVDRTRINRMGVKWETEGIRLIQRGDVVSIRGAVATLVALAKERGLLLTPISEDLHRRLLRCTGIVRVRGATVA
ncbi:MAG: hypothetical protein NUW23_08795, partial [Firmicutes bacterium]|nr:hypothetical protein [Bacillota bacterium]